MAQNYEIDIKRFNGQDYDTLLPTPAAHASTHQADGSDPLTLQAGNYGAASIPTSAYKDASVTRAKLANDVLAGRVKFISTSNYSISADDIATTLFINSNSAIVTLSQTVASAFPIGTTIAIFPFDNGTGNGIVIETTGMRFYIRGGTSGGVGGVGKTARFKIAETYTMIALQKMVTNAQYGDVWTIQGDVEVVS